MGQNYINAHKFMHSSINPQTYQAAGMVANPLCFFLIFFVDDETSAQFLVAVRLSLARQVW